MRRCGWPRLGDVEAERNRFDNQLAGHDHPVAWKGVWTATDTGNTRMFRARGTRSLRLPDVEKPESRRVSGGPTDMGTGKLFVALPLARISHQAGGKTFFSSGRTGRPRGDGAGGHEPAAEAGWSVISRAFLQLGAGNLPATLTMSVAKPWRNVSSPFRREPTERAVPPDPTATANFEDWPAPGRRALDRDSFRPARTTLAAR